MKHSFTLGGLLGFGLSFTSALLAGSSADEALRDAALCSVAFALLFRWVRASLGTHVALLLRQRAQAAEIAEAAAN